MVLSRPRSWILDTPFHPRYYLTKFFSPLPKQPSPVQVRDDAMNLVEHNSLLNFFWIEIIYNFMCPWWLCRKLARSVFIALGRRRRVPFKPAARSYSVLIHKMTAFWFFVFDFEPFASALIPKTFSQFEHFKLLLLTR